MKQLHFKAILLFLMSLNLSTSYTQNVRKGAVIINPYLGGPNFGFIIGKAVEDEINSHTTSGHFSTDSGIGPNGIRGEFLISERLSIGFDYIYNEINGSGYVDTTINSTVEIKYNINVQSIRHRFLLKANYHFITTGDFNFYGGLGLGLNYRKINIETNIPKFETNNVRGAIWPISGRMALGLTYYSIQPLGINFELGLGGPLVSAGVVLKLNTIKN